MFYQPDQNHGFFIRRIYWFQKNILKIILFIIQSNHLPHEPINFKYRLLKINEVNNLHATCL